MNQGRHSATGRSGNSDGRRSSEGYSAERRPSSENRSLEEEYISRRENSRQSPYQEERMAQSRQQPPREMESAPSDELYSYSDPRDYEERETDLYDTGEWEQEELSSSGSYEQEIYSGRRSPGYREHDNGRKKWPGWKKAAVIGGSILGVLLILVGIAFAYAKSMLGNLERVALPENKQEQEQQLGVTSEAAALQQKSDVTNIALFGVDSRDNDDSGRSDALMVLSIDKTHNKIKITSIARDSYVAVDGYGQTKINHAYAYEGAALAIKTVNQNFNLAITDFVTVNFNQIAEIVNYLGGVTLTLSDAEVEFVNREVTDTYLEYSGEVSLNGEQALAHSRNRDTGSDVERTERQRMVLEAMLAKVKQMNVLQYPELINMILSNCKTSLNDSEMMSLGTWAVTSGAKMEQTFIPSTECNASGETIDEVWYYVYDLTNATNIIHKFIYDDVMPK